jgi:hypothetical protein
MTPDWALLYMCWSQWTHMTDTGSKTCGVSFGDIIATDAVSVGLTDVIATDIGHYYISVSLGDITGICVTKCRSCIRSTLLFTNYSVVDAVSARWPDIACPYSLTPQALNVVVPPRQPEHLP